MNKLPKVGDIITVLSGNKTNLMIGKVLTQFNEASDKNRIRGNAIYLTNFGKYTNFTKNDSWCYQDEVGRNWKLSNSWERKWLKMCIEANRYVDPPSKSYTVSDFIKFNK